METVFNIIRTKHLLIPYKIAFSGVIVDDINFEEEFIWLDLRANAFFKHLILKQLNNIYNYFGQFDYTCVKKDILEETYAIKCKYINEAGRNVELNKLEWMSTVSGHVCFDQIRQIDGKIFIDISVNVSQSMPLFL